GFTVSRFVHLEAGAHGSRNLRLPIKRPVLFGSAIVILCAVSLAATKFLCHKSIVVRPGTQRMAARLAAIARTTQSESGHNNQDLIAEFQARLTEPPD